MEIGAIGVEHIVKQNNTYTFFFKEPVSIVGAAACTTSNVVFHSDKPFHVLYVHMGPEGWAQISGYWLSDAGVFVSHDGSVIAYTKPNTNDSDRLADVSQILVNTERASKSEDFYIRDVLLDDILDNIGEVPTFVVVDYSALVDYKETFTINALTVIVQDSVVEHEVINIFNDLIEWLTDRED